MPTRVLRENADLAPTVELTALVERIFESCGMSDPDARLLADTLVWAEITGVHSHGLLRIEEYVRKLTTGGVDPKGRPRIVHEDGCCLVVDGGNSMGQIGMTFAMDRTIERARTTGIAATAIRGSNHAGAMAYYARMALVEDMIGLATTNSLPTMSPIGGAERVIGINPLAVAIPTGEELPFVYDAAFSASSVGKIRFHALQGKTIPSTWATDAHGQPTTDPNAAIDGLLLPIGGYKGVALAMITGMLSSLLSGAAYGTELGDLESGPVPGKDGHFVMAVRVSAFENIRRFKERVDGVIRQVHESKRAPEVERLFVPGEIEHDESVRYGDGAQIALDSFNASSLRKVASERGISTAGLEWLS